MTTAAIKQDFHTAPKVLPYPIAWFGLAIAVLCLDWFTDPLITFPLGFVFPVVLAAYYRGFGWGALFAVVLPMVRFGSSLLKDVPWPISVSAINLGIRVAMLCGLAWLVARHVGHRRQIEALKRLLPICAWCGRIRAKPGTWQRLETYLSADAGLSFTHTICPECEAKQLAQAP